MVNFVAAAPREHPPALYRPALLPASIVVAIGVLLGVALPIVNRAVPFTDEIRPGDRLALGAGLVITPPVGWSLAKGVRAGSWTASPVEAGTADADLIRGGAEIKVHIARFEGTAADLLRQVNRHETLPGFASGTPQKITALGAIPGLTETFRGTAADGALAAYVFPRGHLGMTVAVRVPSGRYPAYATEITAMLLSLTVGHAS